jgi:hypothetical protein
MPEQSQEPEYLSGPPHSAVAAIDDRGDRDQRSRLQHRSKKLLRKKENESWTIRSAVAAVHDRRSGQSLTSPTLGVGGNLLCKIIQFGSFGEFTLPACGLGRRADMCSAPKARHFSTSLGQRSRIQGTPQELALKAQFTSGINLIYPRG